MCHTVFTRLLETCKGAEAVNDLPPNYELDRDTLGTYRWQFEIAGVKPDGQARHWSQQEARDAAWSHHFKEANTVKLSNLWFTPSQLFQGLWQATATCDGQQYDMSEEATVSRRVARARMKERASAYFCSLKSKELKP